MFHLMNKNGKHNYFFLIEFKLNNYGTDVARDINFALWENVIRERTAKLSSILSKWLSVANR